MDPILHTIRSSAGTYSRTMGRTIPRTILHIRNTTGHTIRRIRSTTGRTIRHTIHRICSTMDYMTMRPSTKGCNACSNTMSCLCCMAYNMTMD